MNLNQLFLRFKYNIVIRKIPRLRTNASLKLSQLVNYLSYIIFKQPRKIKSLIVGKSFRCILNLFLRQKTPVAVNQQISANFILLISKKSNTKWCDREENF